MNYTLEELNSILAFLVQKFKVLTVTNRYLLRDTDFIKDNQNYLNDYANYLEYKDAKEIIQTYHKILSWSGYIIAVEKSIEEKSKEINFSLISELVKHHEIELPKKGT